ncbi:flagellar biosynthesis anti-sigma factor FlgM [Romboutsia sp.]|uniref:flagellar biosynthesis anti-sigma factor FlgM n=1 Tax=Romboutsia sp. TaxID=1965302 RepID=UPI002CBE6E61|nr:flagellar biosynthesis anti-sigma factor FlgM [Romboutsia sp.]HSQ88015.1 flagellar biosynthesis anti-sigma factor FlgM [Romboutsia sp.]
MNISPVKFRNIENIYKANKMEVKNVDSKRKDTIEISELGKYLNKVNANKEEVDINKINELKRKIENGTYKVDSKALAKKIIDSMKGEI